MMMVFTLGEKIRAKRKEKKMTLKDLAGDRITPGQISLVESGKSNPSNDLLEYLAQRLNTKIDYFLESEEEQAKRLCEYYLNVANIAMYLEQFNTAEELADKGIKLAKQYRIPHYAGVLELVRAKIKLNLNELEEAQQYCISANSTFLKENDIEYSVKSFMMLGHISIELGYLNTALNYLMHGETILSENNYINENLRAELYNNIAKCYSKSNNHHRAIEYANMTTERLAKLGDKRQYARQMLKLCLDSEAEGRTDDALSYAREARRFHTQVSEVHEIAEIETSLGEIYGKAQKFDESIDHFEDAIKLKDYIDDNTLPMTMLKMSEVYNENNNSVKALSIMEDMGKDLEDNQHFYVIKRYEQLYNIFSKDGNIIKAEQALLDGIEYIEMHGTKRQLGDFYSMLGKLYIEMGRQEQALSYISKGIDIYKELGIILTE